MIGAAAGTRAATTTSPRGPFTTVLDVRLRPSPTAAHWDEGDLHAWGVGPSKLGSAASALGDHREQRDHLVAGGRADVDALGVPTVPRLIPLGHPREKGVAPGRLGDVGVVYLDLGIKLRGRPASPWR